LGAWLLSLVLVLLTTVTPLEFTPLWLGNLPRWGLWGLAFPACHRLRTGSLRLPWLWTGLPWLLWGLLVVGEGLFAYGIATHTPRRWAKLMEPLQWLFANQARWRPGLVLFTHGRQHLTHQLLWHPRYGVVDIRQVQLLPLLPGLQWAKRLPEPLYAAGVLDESWQVADTASAGMSRDTSLPRRIRPWLRKHPEGLTEPLP
jgi:hypothetical protein